MKVVSEIFKMPNGAFAPMFYCRREDGQIDQDVTSTLLMAVEECTPAAIASLAVLIDEVAAGTYVPHDPVLPDWGVNDKNFWFGPPYTKPHHVLISNENIEDYSIDHGKPQEFSLDQVRAALDHWRRFLETVRLSGKESFEGEKFESTI